MERYNKEKDEVSDQAKEFERERELVSRRADRFEGGEVILEIALIICSLTLLTRKKYFWFSGIALGIVGAAMTATGFLLH